MVGVRARWARKQGGEGYAGAKEQSEGGQARPRTPACVYAAVAVSLMAVTAGKSTESTAESTLASIFRMLWGVKPAMLRGGRWGSGWAVGDISHQGLRECLRASVCVPPTGEPGPSCSTAVERNPVLWNRSIIWIYSS